MKIKHIPIIFLAVLFTFLLVPKQEVRAYGECDDYGVMATYDRFTDSCKCLSGYVFGELLGRSYCVSTTQWCSDKYGYSSTYSYLSESCTCSYGSVFANSYGRTQCVSGSSLCSQKHGYNSSFDNSSKSCGCDSGYTFDDSDQCVRKQNNVYFSLKEIDIDTKRAIIKSDYDYQTYVITFGYGCYTNSFKRYVGDKIIVNLGTDYYLDTWDKIVLQDDDEVCDITTREKVSSTFSFDDENEDEDVLTYEELIEYSNYLNNKNTNSFSQESTPPTATTIDSSSSSVKNFKVTPKPSLKEQNSTFEPMVQKESTEPDVVEQSNPTLSRWYRNIFNWVIIAMLL